MKEMEKRTLKRGQFSELSEVEAMATGGEGFAYDAGRFVRAMVQLAGGAGGYASFAADYITLQIANSG